MLDPTQRKPLRELPEINAATDTRDYLAEATRQAREYDDYELLVDVDAHLQEGGFFHEIIELLGNDVLKQTAQGMMRPGSLPLINMQPGMSFQSLSGRVPHQSGPQEKTDDPGKAGHRFVQIVRRTIETMGLDYQVIFPTAMLHLGMNPMEDIEVELARAYARWLTERILPEDPRIIALLYLRSTRRWNARSSCANTAGGLASSALRSARCATRACITTNMPGCSA